MLSLCRRCWSHFHQEEFLMVIATCTVMGRTHSSGLTRKVKLTGWSSISSATKGLRTLPMSVLWSLRGLTQIILPKTCSRIFRMEMAPHGHLRCRLCLSRTQPPTSSTHSIWPRFGRTRITLCGKLASWNSIGIQPTTLRRWSKLLSHLHTWFLELKLHLTVCSKLDFTLTMMLADTV